MSFFLTESKKAPEFKITIFFSKNSKINKFYKKIALKTQHRVYLLLKKYKNDFVFFFL